MRILAIDIGSANIKTVILETKFKRFDIVFHDISPVSDSLLDFSPNEFFLSDGQLSAITNLQQKFAHSIDHIVTNLPLSLYGSRISSFPFRDKKKINAAVQFAIEDEIPFNVDDCIVSSHIFPSKTKETHVLTAYAPLEPLKKLVEAFDAIPLPVNVFTIEQTALASAFAKENRMMENSVVLNMGHRKSSIYFFRNGMPVLHRTTMVGGYHLTKAIAEKYEVSMAEAEIAKIDRAFMFHPDLEINEDQRIFANLIESTLEPFFTDVQQSFMAFSSRFNENCNNIYLLGGCSLIPGLPRYLTERWGKRTEHYELTRRFTDLSIQPQKNSEIMLPIASSLAFSQLSGEAKSQINFRTGKLRVQSKALELNLKQFLYPAQLAMIVYLFALFSLTGQMFALKSSLAKKEDALDQTIQSVLGKVSNSFLISLKSSPTKLKQNVNKKIEELSAQVGSDKDSSFSSLELIQTLSKAIPKSTTLEIRQMELSPNSIMLQISTPTEESAKSAMSALSKQVFFINGKSGAIEQDKNRKKFTFRAGVNYKKETN